MRRFDGRARLQMGDGEDGGGEQDGAEPNRHGVTGKVQAVGRDEAHLLLGTSLLAIFLVRRSPQALSWFGRPSPPI